eukprot:1219780-Pyramimonas_sp.AAC.1
MALAPVGWRAAPAAKRCGAGPAAGSFWRPRSSRLAPRQRAGNLCRAGGGLLLRDGRRRRA